MVALHPEYIVDENAKRKSVLVSLKEWQKIIEALEELDDIRVYDSAKKKKQTYMPFNGVSVKSRVVRKK